MNTGRDITGGIPLRKIAQMRKKIKVGDTIKVWVVDAVDRHTHYPVNMEVTGVYPYFLTAAGWGRYAGRKLSVSILYVDMCMSKNKQRRRKDD